MQASIRVTVSRLASVSEGNGYLSLISHLSGHRSRCEQILLVFLVHRGIIAEEQELVGLRASSQASLSWSLL